MKRMVQVLLLILFSIIIMAGSWYIIFEVLGGGSTGTTGGNTEYGKSSLFGTDRGSGSDVSRESTENTTNMPQPLSEDTGVIYIGDSRFVGMNDVCHIDNGTNRFIVAKVGQGLSWLKRDGLVQAQQIEASHPELTHFKYVICLGVNDLVNINDYMEEYRQLAVGHDLTLVSVGPVGQYPGLSNEEIEGFNSQIKALCEELQIPYVDDYTVLTTEGYETQDGLHYKDAVYERIYQILKQQVEGITS